MGKKPNKIELPESEYWNDRFTQLENAQHNKAVDYDKNLLKQYRRTQKEVEEKIRAWYQRFADNNEVTLADAKKMLKKSELAELKWDVNEYIKYGQENGIDQRWMKELENASAKFHISRLEAIQLNVRNSIEQLYDGQLKGTKKVLGEIYKDGVYHSAYEIQKGLGVGFDTARIDQNEIEKVLAKPWAVDGRNFSERIWGSKKKLINEVENELTSMVATGKSPDKAIQNIMDKFGASKYNASRLIMTESAYFNSLATNDELKDLGVDQFEILATLDSHTSSICRAMDGKHFNVSDYKVGVTAPPFHPHCRTTTVPYFDDEFTVDEVRAARNDDSQDASSYYIPSNIKYNEWEEAFVNGDHEGFTPITGENGKIIFKRDEPAIVNVKESAKMVLDRLMKSIADKEEVIKNMDADLDKYFWKRDEYTSNGLTREEFREWKDSFDYDAEVKRYTDEKMKLQEMKGDLADARIDYMLEGNKSFQEATAVKEAEEYAKNVLGINASYKGCHVHAVNEWNKGLTGSKEAFPELFKKQIKFTGECHERAKVAKQAVYDDVYQKMINSGFSEADAVTNAKKQAALFGRRFKTSKHTTANSWTPGGIYEPASGICLNKDFYKDYDTYISSHKHQVEIKWHPEACDTVKSTYDHEFGHQIDDFLDIRHEPEIQQLFNKRTHEQITDDLSQYSWNNRNPNRYSEMIAEGWAEYCNNPTPREMAKTIGEVIRRKYREWAKTNL